MPGLAQLFVWHHLVPGTWCSDPFYGATEPGFALVNTWHIHSRVSHFIQENTKCDDMTSTTHFPVPFGPIFQILFLEVFLFPFFSTS